MTDIARKTLGTRLLKIILLAAFLLAVALAVCVRCGRRSAEFVTEPYLEQPGPTTITVRWSTAAPSECIIRYGTGEEPRTEAPDAHPGAAWKSVAVRYSDAVETVTPTEYLYKAELSGLTPGTEYRYTVVSSGTELSGAFHTAPAGSAPFTFIAYGDSRTQPEVHFEVASCFPQHKPAFILHTGDMADTGYYEEWNDLFFRPLASVIRNTPIRLARGNHEGNAVALRQLFTFPPDGFYYSFDWADAHFVCLDPYLGRATPRMRAWCDADLAKSTARWKFVFYHNPTFDVGKHRSQWGRTDLLPIFRRNGVDFVLTGHSHGYQRFRPMFLPGENEQHPITHIVTAGGGAPLYRVGTDPCLAARASAYHYVVFSVDRDHASFRTLRPDGSEIDALTVTKDGEGRFNKEYLSQAVSEATFSGGKSLTRRQDEGYDKRGAATEPATSDTQDE